MIRPALALVHSRRNFAQWGRDRQLQIFAELSALRADLRRLQRQTTDVARCHRCRQLRTITLQASGDWLCAHCVAAPKEETA